MINIPIFTGTVVAAVIGLYITALTPPSEDPFAEKHVQQNVDLGPIAQPTIATVKLHHAVARTPFEIGLFGNSRMLMVGARALNRSTEKVFNFALTSESFDGSVMMIDRLAALSRLPKTIVISLDNLHLQRDNSPLWPKFWARLTHASKGVKMAFRDGLLITALRRMWRFAWSEMVRFDMNFDPVLIRLGLVRVFKDIPFKDASAGSVGYRSDGSREMPVEMPVHEIQIKTLTQTTARLDIQKFRRNLARLGAYAAAGHNVIVIETPVHPSSQNILEAARPEFVQNTLFVWQTACATWALHCIGAPLLPDKPDAPWYDATHPPEKPWAKFITEIIEEVIN